MQASESDPNSRDMPFLTAGFRPFFLGAGLWAVLSMLLWVGYLSHSLPLPSAFDPPDWHAHAFLFGYVTAVVAGFLLTAVPNWTRGAPLTGKPLAGLFALWVAGRCAVLFSTYGPALLIALIDLAFLIALSLFLLRDILGARNWRNLTVVGFLALLMLANAAFHWEAAGGERAASGYGMRLGLMAMLLLIAFIGGRIVPSFTRNWLVKTNPSAPMPAPVMERFDKLALLSLIVGMSVWVVIPGATITAAMLVLAGLLNVIRQARWSPLHTLPEPLVWIMHLGYLFLSAGAILLGLSIAAPAVLDPISTQHLWMAGAVGVMSLAIMTRAARGHSGHSLEANFATVVIYTLAIVAVIGRSLAGLTTEYADLLHQISGISWIGGFLLFTATYGVLCVRPRRTT